MRKTGILVSWLVAGILASACSDSSSRKDASPFGDSGLGDAIAGGDTGASETLAGDTAAGTTTGGDVGAQASVINIGSGMRFANPDMVVQAGATITVQNQDTLPHTVTSEAAPNAFQPSGAFDTGIIAGGGSATITIPATATPGTIFYYYCTIHTVLMSPPNGMITVQ